MDPENGVFGKKDGNTEMGKDYIDPNEPFVTKNPFVPGGILAHYKKKAGLTAKDIM